MRRELISLTKASDYTPPLPFHPAVVGRWLYLAEEGRLEEIACDAACIDSLDRRDIAV